MMPWKKTAGSYEAKQNSWKTLLNPLEVNGSAGERLLQFQRLNNSEMFPWTWKVLKTWCDALDFCIWASHGKRFKAHRPGCPVWTQAQPPDFFLGKIMLSWRKWIGSQVVVTSVRSEHTMVSIKWRPPSRIKNPTKRPETWHYCKNLSTLQKTTHRPMLEINWKTFKSLPQNDLTATQNRTHAQGTVRSADVPCQELISTDWSASRCNKSRFAAYSRAWF